MNYVNIHKFYSSTVQNEMAVMRTNGNMYKYSLKLIILVSKKQYNKTMYIVYSKIKTQITLLPWKKHKWKFKCSKSHKH